MKRRTIYHIGAWIFVGAVEYTAYPAHPGAGDLWFFVLRMMLFMAAFYFHAIYLFEWLAVKKTRVKGLVAWAVSAALYGVIFYLLFQYFYFARFHVAIQDASRKVGGTNMSTIAVALRAMITIMVVYYFASLLGARFYWLTRRVRITRAKAARLEKQTLEDEFEKIRLQNMFLRSQINPHFLHNTLNFFYARLLPVSPELSEGILTLSNVMRYSLQQEEDEKGMVYLDKEVEHLYNVVAIHQMRFSNNLNIRFDVQGETAGVKLIPLVFITLLENAFKHGHLNDKNTPVHISLVVDQESILFRISNRKKSGPKEISHGIGIGNIRKRLDYVYQGNYRFDIQDGGEHYRVELALPMIKN